MIFLRKLMLVALLAVAAQSLATEMPGYFSAVYDVHHSGARIGEMTLSLSRSPDSNQWELNSRTRPKGLAALIRRRDVIETSLFEFDGQSYLPRSYHFDEGSRSGRRNSRIDFDWTAGVAKSLYKNEEKVLTLAEGMVDRLLLQLVLMRDIAADALPHSYTVLDRNASKTYEITLLDGELLPTPAGQFETVKVRRQRPGSSRAALIWAAPELAFLPVKMIQLKDDRPNAVLTLTEVQGLR